MRSERVKLLALCRVKGLSWYLIAREARRPDGLQRLSQGHLTESSKEAKAAKDALASVSSETLNEYQDWVERELESAAAEGIRITSVLDDDYPLNLRTIYNLPPFLFYRGSLDAEQDARSVAVVGTREASPEGLSRAKRMARLLSERGITVLSGLALGIDTQAHLATLEAGGRRLAAPSSVRRDGGADHRRR